MKAVLPLFDAERPSASASLSPPAVETAVVPQPQSLWLGLYFSELPLAVFAPEQEALVVADAAGGRRRVVAANKAARQVGIEAGMTVSAAYALAGGLRVKLRDTAAEQALLERLACWAMQFSSQVSPEDGQGLLLEVAGSLRLFGGLDGLRESLDAALQRLGLWVRYAMAPTSAAAWAMVRLPLEEMAPEEMPPKDQLLVTDVQALRAALGPYPVECLGLDEKRLSRLHGMGVKRLEDLWRLPREGLAKRFGKGFVQSCRRLLGEESDPRLFHQAPPRYEGALPLVRESRNSERLLLGIERLLEEMHGLLHAYDAGVRELEIGLWHEGCPATRFTVRRSRASRDPQQWRRVIAERFARLQLPAAVCELGLRAENFESTQPVVGDLFSRVSADHEPMDQLIERLQARLGRDQVRGLCCFADHRPEKAMRWRQPGEYTETEMPPNRPARPLWLLDEPRLLDDLSGIQTLSGPERIETGWWDGDDVCRDYWVARDEAGAWCWIFQDRRSRQWYLHGWFG